MTVVDGWLSWAIKAPGPAEKGRYPGDPERAMSEILYIVMHLAGGWEPFLRRGHRPGEDASWTFSNCQGGDFYQHYPLSALTWTSGAYTQNRDGLACENEGMPGWSMNAAQIANARRMREDVKTVCPNLRAPLLGAGFREHSELMNGATDCPSGAIVPFYRSYLQAREEDMPLNEEDKTWLRDAIEFRANKAIKDSGLMAAIGRVDKHTDEREKATQAALKVLSDKLDTMPTLAVDAAAIAKAVNDDLHNRTKE